MGLRITVNTDNRMVTNTSVSREFQVIHEELGFNLEEIKEVIIMGFKSAFLPYALKRALLAEVVHELKAFKPGSLESKREQL
jgi:adenosine deaminase